MLSGPTGTFRHAVPDATSRHGRDRRTVLTGAAWSIPVIAVASTAPLAAASGCLPQTELSTLTATFVRANASSAYFQWENVFTPGDRIRLTVTAAILSGAGALHSSWNLSTEVAPSGSTFGTVAGATSALRLSLNTPTTFTTAQYDFAFSYAPTGTGFAPYAGASGAQFTVTDIDGAYITNGGGLGAERVHFSTGASGTAFNTGYLTGSGTAASPWVRRAGSVPSIVNIDTYTSSVGNVSATASASSWSLTFSAAAPGESTNYNLWITPFRFTATNPVGC